MKLPDNRLLVISEIGCGPPYLGNRIRMRALLREIRQLGLEIHFAGVALSEEEKLATGPCVDQWVFDFQPCSTPKSTHLVGRIARKLRHLLFGQSIIRETPPRIDKGVDQWFHPHWSAQARKLQRTGKYQRVLVAYVFHSAFFECFPDTCLKILDTHDVFADRAAKLEGQGIGNFWFTLDVTEERRGVLRADVILAIQHEEAGHFRKLTGGRREIRTVGHFVEPRILAHTGTQMSAPCCGYLASDNPINVDGITWFLGNIWPEVLLHAPTARLLIGGRICKLLDAMPSVDLLGEVATVEDFYSRCLFTINPMRGGTGLKIKTVESLSYGRAVVTTTVGAEGITGHLRDGFEVCDDAHEFAGAITRWLASPEAAISRGAAAVEAMSEFNRSSHEELSRSLRMPSAMKR